MERENPLKFIACAVAALAAGVAFSAAVSDNFEDGNIPTDWEPSDAAIVAETISTVGGGFAIEGNHDKVLSVSGEATRNSGIESDANQGQADFLVNISEASDADTFSNDSAPGEGVQIAIAAGDTITDPVSPATLGTVKLRIYCKAKSNGGVLATNPGWLTEGPSITTGEWHRVSLVFDYVNKLCKVSVDGAPYVSTSGFLKADKIDTTTSGAWYGLANTSGDTGKISSLSFVGAAKVDDVVIDGAEAVSETYSGNGATVDGLNVSYAQLNAWGVDSTTIGTAELDDSGLTVAEKVVAGLVGGTSMTDGTKFEAKAMKMTDAGTATIALPAGTVTTGRTYTINYTKADGTKDSVPATPGEGVLTVTGLPTDTAVLTFTITASGPAN